MSEHRLAIGLVILTFLLILLGGYVHNTDSSLACPDWPTCYGSLMPEMKGQVAIEHGHRLLASTVGLLTIILSLFLFRKRPDLKYWGLLAVFAVIVQGVLGGITVLYRLPTMVSTAHLGLSFLFFALIIYLAWKTSPFDASTSVVPSNVPKGKVRFFVGMVAFLVYAQSLLGAFMRHTGAGLVCPEFPLCYGSLWPSGMSSEILLHMSHRWFAVVVTVAVLSLPLVIREKGWLWRLSLVACLLVLIQIGFGIASIWTYLGTPAVTAHLGGAAALWAVMVIMNFLSFSSSRTVSLKGARG